MLENWNKMNKYDMIYFILLALIFLYGIAVFAFADYLPKKMSPWPLILLSPIIITIYTIFLKIIKKGFHSVKWGIIGNICIATAIWFAGCFLMAIIGNIL